MKRASTRNVVLSKAMKHVDEETRREFREKRLQALESDNYTENEIAQVDDDAYNESDDDKGTQKRKRAKSNQKGNNTKSKWATKIVKPLERILLDNGITQDHYPTSSKKSPAPDCMMDIEDENNNNIIIENTTNRTGIYHNNTGKKLGRFSSNSLQNMDLNTNNTIKQQQYKKKNISTTSSSSSKNNDTEEEAVNYYTITAKPSVFPLRQCFCSVCGYLGSYSCTRCGSKFCSIRCNENHKETRCFKFSM